MLFFLLLLFLADPTAAELLRQGLLEMQAGKLPAAVQSLTRASEIEKTNPMVWVSLAEARRRSSETKPALEAAEKAEQFGGKDPSVAHALAMFYVQMNRPEKAAPLEQIFAQSSKADRDAGKRTAELFANAGQALLAAGKAKEAALDFQRSWELSDKQDGQIALDYAQALLRDQQFAKAADLATAISETKPNDPQWQLVLGVARYGQRRFDEAISAFLRTIAVDPSVPQPYLFLGNLLEQAGPQLDQVIAAEQSWADREPGNANAQLTLAKALLQKDRKSERAKTLLERSISLQPNDWEGYYQLGVLLESVRDFPAAASRLERAAQLNPAQALVHYHLARVYDRLGEADKAKSERDLHERLTAPVTGTKP